MRGGGKTSFKVSHFTGGAARLGGSPIFVSHPYIPTAPRWGKREKGLPLPCLPPVPPLPANLATRQGQMTFSAGNPNPPPWQISRLRECGGEDFETGGGGEGGDGFCIFFRLTRPLLSRELSR